MKALLGTGALALALLLGGCGKGGESVSGNSANMAAPLTQIPNPNGDWTQTVTETPEGGFRMGNPNAPVKLVEYASIGCPHCAEFTEKGAEALTNKYVKSGQVSWEYRPFMIFPADPGIFMLLRCHGPNPFFQLTEQLYADQANWEGKLQQMTESQQQQIQAMPKLQQAAALVQVTGLDQFFRQRGMPESRMNSCLADQKALDALAQQTQRAAEKDNVTGTPAFFINGKSVKDVASWDGLEPALRAEIH